MTAHCLVKFASGKRKIYSREDISSLPQALLLLQRLHTAITTNKLVTLHRARIVGSWVAEDQK
jgi:hypothetical protein